MSNPAPTIEDDTVRLPNLSRARFLEKVLHLCQRYELSYNPSDDSLYHCCEALAICLFMDGEHPERHGALRLFLNARGIVRFKGE
jgi:hypothetical protein